MTYRLVAFFLLWPISANAQQSQIINDPFDPYVAVLTWLPKSNFTQNGTSIVTKWETNITTFKFKSNNKIEHYLKLSIEYPAVPGDPNLNKLISVNGASYEGGKEADFEQIEQTSNCVNTDLGRVCIINEVLSVRFFQIDQIKKDILVQFRNRNSTFRGTVSVPIGVFNENIAKLP